MADAKRTDAGTPRTIEEIQEFAALCDKALGRGRR